MTGAHFEIVDSQYSDGMYLGTLISAIGASLLPQVMPEQSQLVHIDPTIRQSERAAELLKEAVAEVDRYKEMDRLVPSTHNIVSVAILEVCCLLLPRPICVTEKYGCSAATVEFDDDDGQFDTK